MKPLHRFTGLLAAVLMTTTAFASASNVQSFVRQTFHHGVPYEEAIRFDAASSMPELLGMLSDPNEQQYWGNIVITLGMIGDESAIEPLIRFLEKDSGERLSRSHYLAKTAVPMALGYALHKGEKGRALSYLIESAKPGAWAKRKLGWISPDHNNARGRDEQLSKMAILGLAVSGNASGKNALVELSTSSQDSFLNRVRPVITEALQEHDKISSQGLVRYYAR